jgi:hypothetical protein
LYAGGLLLLFAALISCTPLVPITGSEVPTTPPPSDHGTLPVTVLDETGNPLDQGVVVRVSNSTQVDDSDNNGLRIASCDHHAAMPPGRGAMSRCENAMAKFSLSPNGHDNVYYSLLSHGNRIQQVPGRQYL